MNVIDRWYSQVWAQMDESGSSEDLGLEEWLFVHPDYLSVNPPPKGVELPPLALSDLPLELDPEEYRFNPNHGKDGKFSSGGGGHSGGQSKSEGVSKAMLLAAHDPDGGITISSSGNVPTTGYVIAQEGTSGFVGLAGDSYDAEGNPGRDAFTPETLDNAVAYIKAHGDAQYVGAWHNPKTAEITFDIVDVHPDSIGDAEAIRRGKAANQESIYHITTGRVISTGGTGDKRSGRTEGSRTEGTDEGGNSETTEADFGNDGRRDSSNGKSDVDAGDAGDAKEVDDHTDSAMVALMLSKDVAEKIALPDGEPVDNLHVTVVYLGDIVDLDETAIKNVLSGISFPAPEGTIGGIGRFPKSHKEGMQAVWVPVDVPGLSEFYDLVSSKLIDAGLIEEQEHGYTAHITLDYVTIDEPTPEPVAQCDVQWSSFTLVWGNERTEYPFVAQSTAEIERARLEQSDHDPTTGKWTTKGGAASGISSIDQADIDTLMNAIYGPSGKKPFPGPVKSGTIINPDRFDPINGEDLGGPIEEYVPVITDPGGWRPRGGGYTVRRMHNGHGVVTTKVYDDPNTADADTPANYLAYDGRNGPRISASVELALPDGRNVFVGIERDVWNASGDSSSKREGWSSERSVEYHAREAARSMGNIHQRFDTGIRPPDLGHPNILITAEDPVGVAGWVRMSPTPAFNNTINIPIRTLERTSGNDMTMVGRMAARNKRLPYDDVNNVVDRNLGELDFIMAHEYGHVHHASSLFAGGGLTSMDKASMQRHTQGGQKAAMLSKQLYGKAKQDSGTKPALTDYAKTNAHEAYAEAFTAHISTGGKSKNPIVQAYAKAFNWPTAKVAK